MGKKSKSKPGTSVTLEDGVPLPDEKIAQLAIERIESAEAELTATSDRVKPILHEAWRDYGAALLRGQETRPSTQEFNAWVKDNHLDRGPCKHNTVRSDAMWLAKHWDDFAEYRTKHTVKNQSPQHIRQELRKADCDWAGGRKPKPKKNDEQLWLKELEKVTEALVKLRGRWDEIFEVTTTDEHGDPTSVGGWRSFYVTNAARTDLKEAAEEFELLKAEIAAMPDAEPPAAKKSKRNPVSKIASLTQ